MLQSPTFTTALVTYLKTAGFSEISSDSTVKAAAEAHLKAMITSLISDTAFAAKLQTEIAAVFNTSNLGDRLKTLETDTKNTVDRVSAAIVKLAESGGGARNLTFAIW